MKWRCRIILSVVVRTDFDRQRPFGEIWGPGGFEGYEQDGRRFNPGGDPV
jgi:hypothetical protein